MAVTYSEEFKALLAKEHLEDLRDRILVEMSTRSVVFLSPESAEYLLQAYTDKLAELYY